MKLKTQYTNDLNVRFNDLTANSNAEAAANINELQQNSVNLEQVVIKGINFSLTNGYQQNLNDILINLSVGVDNQHLMKIVQKVRSFAAYYKGIALALNQFHKFMELLLQILIN
nr:hypothetical protein [Entomoplasma sp. MP1]